MSESVSNSTQNPQSGREFIDNTISNPEEPVVLFSLSWCSFCRAAKQLLGQIGVQHRVFELDQGEFLQPTIQQEVRGRLREITNSNTLPQLFIGGEGLGGYTETAVAYRTGKLAQLLHKHGIDSTLPSPD